MANDTIKMDLPLVPGVLRHAATFLTAVADELPRIDPDKLKAADTILEAAGITDGAAAPAAGEEIDTTGIGFGADTTEPPAPPAPPAPLVATVAPEVTLDAKKRPWDNRIHGGGKTFLKTGPRAGEWKYARNTDEALIAQVEAELDAAMAAAPPVSTEPAILSPEDPGLTTNPPAPPAPPAPGATEALDFPGLVQKVTGLINAERLTAEQLNAILAPLGLASLPLVASRPDLIPQIDQEIDKLCPPTP
jgi:hypothetical protein